ncbi:hypothetical protein [Serratia marcescens]|uniref:hypothetical protein n=1 Tax=Serratia marcescens TaxID=615 RepID=UPI003D002195
MKNEELKHVIALLLEDAKRRQELEPNAGTKARIWVAKQTIASSEKEVKSTGITPYLLRLRSVIAYLENIPESEEKKEHFLAELKFIETELK